MGDGLSLCFAPSVTTVEVDDEDVGDHVLDTETNSDAEGADWENHGLEDAGADFEGLDMFFDDDV